MAWDESLPRGCQRLMHCISRSPTAQNAQSKAIWCRVVFPKGGTRELTSAFCGSGVSRHQCRQRRLFEETSPPIFGNRDCKRLTVCFNV